MNLNYQLTSEDFMALQMDSIKNTNFQRARYNILLMLGVLFVFLIGFIIGVVANMHIMPQTITIGLGLSIAVGIGVSLAILLTPFIKRILDPMILWQFKYLLRKDKSLPRDVTLHLHETGIDMSSVHAKLNKNTKVAWESIEEVNEDENRLFLYFEARQAIIIPKNKPSLNEAEQQML